MKKVFERLLKQSLIILGIVIVFIICSSIFGSIHMMTEGMEESIAIAKEQSNRINIDGEVDDVEGYGYMVNGLVSVFSYFATGLLWIVKILMQIVPIVMFTVVSLSNLIAWLFNLGKEEVWKRNTGIVFWSINLLKLIIILIMAVAFMINIEFKMPYLSYFGCIIVITLVSIIWQVILMIKNKESLRIVKKEN